MKQLQPHNISELPQSQITDLVSDLAGKEPTITKNTAFNKNFGTTAGTVLEGDKDAEYAKKGEDTDFDGNLGVGVSGDTSTNGQAILLEKGTVASGEGSGRLFFNENNSGLENLYGLSFYYAGDNSPVFDSGFVPPTGNGTWGLTRNNNSLSGDLIMSGFRGSSNVNFYGNVGIGTTSPTSIAHLYQNNSGVGAEVGLTIEQDGTGDAVVQYLLTGVRRWVVGVDNSDFDKFKFSATADVGSGNVWINTSGHIGMDSMPTTASGGRFYVDTNGFVKWAA